MQQGLLGCRLLSVWLTRHPAASLWKKDISFSMDWALSSRHIFCCSLLALPLTKFCLLFSFLICVWLIFALARSSTHSHSPSHSHSLTELTISGEANLWLQDTHFVVYKMLQAISQLHGSDNCYALGKLMDTKTCVMFRLNLTHTLQLWFSFRSLSIWLLLDHGPVVEGVWEKLQDSAEIQENDVIIYRLLLFLKCT